jgi:D-serine deaminase-like pyridoxal phosphate-dependent protein
MNAWYALSNAHDIPTPTVLVYPDRIRQNIARMVELAGGPQQLRPHVKTHKLAQVVQMKLDAGITKFKVATIAEAEMTAAAGGEDILLAHQPSGPNITRHSRNDFRMCALPPSRMMPASCVRSVRRPLPRA